MCGDMDRKPEIYNYIYQCKISMNKQQLEEVLQLNKVPKDLYSLSESLPDETYCLEETKNKWHVYYIERGESGMEKCQ